MLPVWSGEEGRRTGGAVGQGEWQGPGWLHIITSSCYCGNHFIMQRKNASSDAIFRARRSRRGYLNSAKHFSQLYFLRAPGIKSANKHMKLHVWLISHAALWSRLAFIWEIHSLIDKTKAGRPPSRSSKDVSQRIPATQITDTDSTILMLPAEMSKAFLTAAPFFHMHIDNLLIFLPN